MKKRNVALAEDERAGLGNLARVGKAAACKVAHARIPLEAGASQGGPAWQDQQIADALQVGTAAVESLRRRFVKEGLEAALGRLEQVRPKPPSLDGAAEARLVALACSAPPAGRACWTLKPPAGELVELEVVPAVSCETVRRTFQQTRSSRGRRSSG
ncbi:MAG: helix-turn-helix domain-containing protein [Gemmataceae bacterium]|nr:helix-turn-helix domain-containing protein [Gemmataceae bacterium]